MIYVDQKQLDQVEYLIQQSIQGHHVLFDNETLRRVFWCHRDVLSEEKIAKTGTSVEGLIEQMLVLPTLDQKREFLRKLDPNSFTKLIRGYFSIVESNLIEKNGRHLH